MRVFISKYCGKSGEQVMPLDGAASDELDALLAVLDAAPDVDSQLSFQQTAMTNSHASQVTGSAVSAREKSHKKGKRNRRPEGFDPNKARRAMTREIKELRASAKELTERLAALQVAVAVADRGSREVSASWDQGAHGNNSEMVWLELNQSQLAQRLEVVAENTRLKRALDEAVRIVNNLREAAMKSAKVLSQRGVVASLPSRVHILLLDSEADSNMFEMMLKEVDASYHEAPEVFRLNGLSDACREPHFGVQMHENDHGRFMDMFSDSILPFAVADTSRVVWEFYSGPAKHRGQVYFKTTKTINTSHETIIEKFAIEHHAMSMRRDFRVWQIFRRYIEGNRVLVVWITIALPVETSHKPLSSIGYCQKGYLLCEPLRPGLDARFTHLRRCHRVRPYLPFGSERILTDQDKREASIILEWNVGLDTIHLHLEHFENQLLAESMRRQKQVARCQTNA